MKSAIAAAGIQADFNMSFTSQRLNVGLFSAARAGQPSTRRGAFAPIDDNHNRLHERAPFGRQAVGYFLSVPGRRFPGGRID
jgi:hypothetical protein